MDPSADTASGEGNGGEGDDGPALSPDAALSASWQELGIAAAGYSADLASTPSGWLSLSRRTLGDAKAPSAWESYLYRSRDGVRWQQVHVSDETDNLWLRGVAYGGGRYVLAGMRMGESDGAIFHSTDGERWQEIAVATGEPSGLADVVFAGGQFFALGTSRTLLRSLDGVDWQAIDLATTVSPHDVAFGRAQFLLVGVGDLQRSSDGIDWHPSRLSCDMPGACITNPDGEVAQGSHSRVVFAGGTYFIDQASSSDGETWQPLPGSYPAAALGDSVIGTSDASELALWSTIEPPRPLASARYASALPEAERAARMRWNGATRPNEVVSENFPNAAGPPARLEFPLPSGADCASSTCVVVRDRLYLVSPAP